MQNMGPAGGSHLAASKVACIVNSEGISPGFLGRGPMFARGVVHCCPAESEEGGMVTTPAQITLAGPQA